jgi:hypothetical protein
MTSDIQMFTEARGLYCMLVFFRTEDMTRIVNITVNRAAKSKSRCKNTIV